MRTNGEGSRYRITRASPEKENEFADVQLPTVRNCSQRWVKVVSMTTTIISTLSFVTYLLVTQPWQHQQIPAISSCLFNEDRLQSLEATGRQWDVKHDCHSMVIISGLFWFLNEEDDVIDILDDKLEPVSSIKEIIKPRLIRSVEMGDCFVIGRCSLWVVNQYKASLIEDGSVFTSMDSNGNDMFVLVNSSEQAYKYAAKVNVYSISQADSNSTATWNKKREIKLSYETKDYVVKSKACSTNVVLSLVVSQHKRKDPTLFISFQGNSFYEYNLNGQIMNQIFSNGKDQHLYLSGFISQFNILVTSDNKDDNYIHIYNTQHQRWRKYKYLEEERKVQLYSSVIDADKYLVWLLVKNLTREETCSMMQYKFVPLH